MADVTVPRSSRYSTARVITDAATGRPFIYGRDRTPVEVLTTHTVRDGDRLDTLAYAYYGDSSLYWAIADANNIVDPLTLVRGDQLVIPVRRV